MSALLAPLDELPVRDLWGEIVNRADHPATVVDLPVRNRGRASRTTRAVAAAAAVLLVLGVGIAIGRGTGPTRTIRVNASVPAAGWHIGPAISVPSPHAGALPLIGVANQTSFAAFRGARTVVIADGAARPKHVPLDGEIVALGTGTTKQGRGFAATLTGAGALTRIDSSGRVETLAELGPISTTTPAVAVANGRVFVAGSALGGIVAVDIDAPGVHRPVVVGDKLTPTVLAASGDAVWSLDQVHQRLTRIVASTGRASGTITTQDVSAMDASSRGQFLVRPSAGTLSRVDTELHMTDVGAIDPLTTSIAASDATVWATADGVFILYDSNSGRVLDAVGQLLPGSRIASDGAVVWELTDRDGLRQLVRES